MHLVTCPKQGREMEAVVLHRVGFLTYSCPKQGQDFKPLRGTPIPKHGSSTAPREATQSETRRVEREFKTQ